MTVGPITPMSVVLVALVGGPRLQARVDALAPQAAEILVLAPGGSEISCAPDTRLIAVDASVPDKRRIAFEEAKHPVVGFIEDTCSPPPDWCASMHAPFSEEKVALVCGPIVISPRLPPRHRALGITEYARFHPDVMMKGESDRGEARSLIGANFAVRKSAFSGNRADDFIDGTLFARLTAAGEGVVVRSGGVFYDGLDLKGAQITARYHHGRIYGGSRAAGRGGLARTALAAKGLAAPLIQFARACWDAPAWFWTSPTTVLWVIAMTAAWGAGEIVGAVTGSAGASLRRWS